MRGTWVVGVLAVGCAPRLTFHDDTGLVSDTGVDVVSEEGGSMTIDATDYEAFVYVDLESGVVGTPTDPSTSAGWDLAIRRFVIQLNGGESGAGGVVGIVVEDEDYDALEQAPQGEYVADLPDDDDDGVPEYLFENWYLYDASTHILTPADLFYVVRSVEGTYFKVRIDDYYDGAGTPAMMRLTWAVVSPP